MKFNARINLKVFLFLAFFLGGKSELFAQIPDNDGNYVTARVSKIEVGQNNGTPVFLVTLGAVTSGTTPPTSNGSFVSGGGPMLRISFTYTTDSDVRKSLLSVLELAMSMGQEVEFRYYGPTQNYAIVAARIPGN